MEGFMTREQGTYLEPDLDAVAVAPPGRPALGAFFCYTASKGRSSMTVMPGRPAISDRKGSTHLSGEFSEVHGTQQ
jgi:hypothetical protein